MPRDDVGRHRFPRPLPRPLAVAAPRPTESPQTRCQRASGLLRDRPRSPPRSPLTSGMRPESGRIAFFETDIKHPFAPPPRLLRRSPQKTGGQAHRASGDGGVRRHDARHVPRLPARLSRALYGTRREGEAAATAGLRAAAIPRGGIVSSALGGKARRGGTTAGGRVARPGLCRPFRAQGLPKARPDPALTHRAITMPALRASGDATVRRSATVSGPSSSASRDRLRSQYLENRPSPREKRVCRH